MQYHVHSSQYEEEFEELAYAEGYADTLYNVLHEEVIVVDVYQEQIVYRTTGN